MKSEETSPTKKVAVKLHACEFETTNNDGLIIRFHTKYQSLKEVMKFKSHFHFLIRLNLDLIRYSFDCVSFFFFFTFHFNSHHNVVARANPRHPMHLLHMYATCHVHIEPFQPSRLWLVLVKLPFILFYVLDTFHNCLSWTKKMEWNCERKLLSSSSSSWTFIRCGQW